LIVSLPTVIEQGRKEIKPRYNTKQQRGQKNRSGTSITLQITQAEIFLTGSKSQQKKKIGAGQGNDHPVRRQ
jgi:hypothetical protein